MGDTRQQLFVRNLIEQSPILLQIDIVVDLDAAGIRENKAGVKRK